MGLYQFFNMLKFWTRISLSVQYGVRESSTRCNFRKHMQIKKTLRQFDNAHAANAHNTTKKRIALQIKKINLQITKTLSSI